MRKIFEVELGARNDHYTQLTLPATPCAMLDALEKLKLKDSEPPTWIILDIYSCEQIADFLDENGSLFELNALCQQLSLLNEQELAIVEGLVLMEHQSIPMSRFIDMAYSTGRCHLVEEAVDDHTLGRFCAANGFVPDIEGFSDKAFELLDFTKIGREFRQAEGGVFTSGGYVQKHDELRQVYDTLDLRPKTPDYTILVETANGCQIKLPLPAGEAVLDNSVICVDCIAPYLINTSGKTGAWDMLAHRLVKLEADGELTKYKAILAAVECFEPNWALRLADELEQYAFVPEITEYKDVAKKRLAAGLSDAEVEYILPSLNLYSLGKNLVEYSGGTITGYGFVQRGNSLSIQQTEEQPAMGGMEL